MGTKKFQSYMDNNEAIYNEEKEAAEALEKQGHSQNQNSPTKIVVEDSDDDIPPVQQSRYSQQSPKPAPSNSQDIYSSLFVDSQDPDPLGPPPTLEQSNVDLFVEQTPAIRRPPLVQSTDDEEESSSADESDDSLMGEVADEVKNTTRQKATSKLRVGKEPDLGNSILTPKSPGKKATELSAKPTLKQSNSKAPIQGQPSKLSRSLTTPAQEATTKIISVRLNARRQSASAAQISSTTPSNGSNLVREENSVTNSITLPPAPTTTAATSITTQKRGGTTASTSIRRSGVQHKSAIRMTNEPKTHKKKDWQNGERLYNKLKFRHLADVKSRREGTPDLAALSFVGAEPIGLVKSRPSNLADNPYGRREAGSRRVQDSDDDEYERRDSIEKVAPLQNWEADKVPLVCPSWRLSNNCFFGPQVCKFMHRHKDEHGQDLPIGDISGYVPPKYRKPPLTCAFWLSSHIGCKKPDAECEYAHRNTGWMPKSKIHKDEPVSIDPNALPLSDQTTRGSAKSRTLGLSEKRKTKPFELTCWYWTQNKCHKKPEHCMFQHFDTGTVADPPPSALTCRFWSESTCALTADQCKFQHYNTGVVSGRPSGKSSVYLFAMR
jgi:chromo domain-containing protein 1